MDLFITGLPPDSSVWSSSHRSLFDLERGVGGNPPGAALVIAHLNPVSGPNDRLDDLAGAQREGRGALAVRPLVRGCRIGGDHDPLTAAGSRRSTAVRSGSVAGRGAGAVVAQHGGRGD